MKVDALWLNKREKMKPKYLLLTGLALAALLLLPEHLLSATTDTFGSKDVYEKTTEIKDFLLGPATRFAAVLGLGWGVMQAIISSAIRPLLFWGAIGLTVSIGSGLLDKMFPENTMMIPDQIEEKVE